MGERNTNQPSWRVRRRLIHLSLAFDAAVILLSLLGKADPAVASTAVSMAFAHGGAVLASYVFGAAWEDISLRKGAP